MKFVISAHGVKREINAPLLCICGSDADLEALAHQITDALWRWRAQGVVFGWVPIWSSPPAMSATPPKPWCES